MPAGSSRLLTLASRPSKLALWQTRAIQALLAVAHPDLEFETHIIETRGDRTLDRPLPEIGGKGLFTEELESALRSGEVDLAVHSLKDLPIDDSNGIAVGAILTREDPRDVLVSRGGETLAELPRGAGIGMSSLRRQAQILALRGDLEIKPIRGNVETRIRKVLDGHYDAALLAAAGVKRLGLVRHVSEWLSFETVLPAPGQAALAVQCRDDDLETKEILAAIHDPDLAGCVTAERAFLGALGGGCSAPIAAFAEVTPTGLRLRGLIAAVDGTKRITVEGIGEDAIDLGARLATRALEQGATEILAHV